MRTILYVAVIYAFTLVIVSIALGPAAHKEMCDPKSALPWVGCWGGK